MDNYIFNDMLPSEKKFLHTMLLLMVNEKLDGNIANIVDKLASVNINKDTTGTISLSFDIDVKILAAALKALQESKE